MRRPIIYESGAQLRHPGRFLVLAAHDMRLAATIAGRLFVANLKARHRRALLSYLWLVLPTLMMTAIWLFLQSSRLIDVGQVGMPYPVYVLSGMLLWHLFLDALNSPLSQLTGAKSMVTRSRVPLEALVAAGAIETMFNFVVRLLLLIPVLIAYGTGPGSTILIVPFAAVLLALLGFSLGLFLAPLGALYEDVGRAVGLATGILFFLTPIVYPVPDSGLVRLNPVTPLLDLARRALTADLRTDISAIREMVFGAAIVLPLLLAGLVLLRLARPHLVARLG